MAGPLDIKGIAELTDRVTPVLRQIGASMRRIAGDQTFTRLSAQASSVTKAFGGVASATGRLAADIAALGALAGVAGVGVAAFAGYTVKAFADAGGGLADASAKIGMSAERLQELRYAAMLTGVEADALTNGLNKFNKVLAETQAGKNKKAAEYFKAMGINIKGAKLEDVLPKISEAFMKNGNAAQRTAAAMLLFGKAGADMIPMLIGGRDNLAAMAKEARDLGIIISESDVAAADDLGDNMDKLRKAIGGLGVQIGAKLAPVIGPVITDMIEWIKANREWLTTTIGDGVRDLITWVRDLDWSAVTNGLKAFTVQAREFMSSIGGWKAVLGGIGAVLFGPLALAIANVGIQIVKLGVIAGGWATVLGLGLLAGAIYNWDEFVAALGRVRTGFRELFDGNVIQGLTDIIGGALDGAAAALKGAVALIGDIIGVDLVKKIEGATQFITDALNKYLLGPFQWVVDQIKQLLGSISLPAISAPNAPRGSPLNNQNTVPGGQPSTYGPGRSNPGYQQQGSLLENAAQAGVIQSGGQRSGATLDVRFSNAPPGTKAQADSSGPLFSSVNMKMGYAMEGTG